MVHEERTRYEAVAMVRRGATAREAARALGVSHRSVSGWCAARGVALRPGIGGAVSESRRQAPPGSGPGRIGLEQRLAIAAGVAAGLPCSAIARGVGFSRSSVSRELARNGGREAYDPYRAQSRAEALAARPKPRRLDAPGRLRSYVLSGLRRGWSPEQVSERLREDFPDEEGMRVSHEAIYRALYVQGRGSLRQELRVERALRSGRASRRPRSALPPRAAGRSWVEGCEISLRPAEAADRAVPGHWEGDLVVGSDGRSCLVTLVERSTRLLLARRLDMHPTSLVTDALADMVSGVPGALLRTVTWDRGVEMAGHARFTEATGVRVYFCDPRSPWQRGTNENTNGLLRQYFPKGTDFSRVTDEEVREAQDLLNGRPRKTLGWRTPSEKYLELLEEDMRALTY